MASAGELVGAPPPGRPAPGGPALRRPARSRHASRRPAGSRWRLGPGLGVVGASVLAGLAAFGYLALADRSLGPAAKEQFAVLYALAVFIGFGAFQPVESELARTLGHRADVATGLREGALVAGGTAVVAAAAVGAAAVPLLDLLGGSRWLLAALLGVVAVSALQFWVRGALLGRGRPTAFAATLAVDSLLRVAVAGALVLAVTAPSASTFSLSLLLPLLLAHLAFVPGLRRGVAPPAVGERPAPVAVLRRIAPLYAATLSAQLLLGAPVLLVAALAPGSAAAFLFAFNLARVPLFAAVPVQGALVPPMAAMVVAGRLDRLVRLLLAVTAVVLALAVVGGALAGWLGPAVLQALFPRSPAVPGTDLALMVVGVAAHLGLLVTAQATVAAGHHRGAGAAWGAGLGVAAAVFAAGPVLDPSLAVLPRVEVSFLTGSAAGWALAVVLLLRHARAERAHRPAHRPAPGPAPADVQEVP